MGLSIRINAAAMINSNKFTLISNGKIFQRIILGENFRTYIGSYCVYINLLLNLKTT